MTLPLLPGAPEPRECLCGRPVPKGPLVHGWGSSCARQRGFTTPPAPKSSGQEGPDLFDAARDAGVSAEFCHTLHSAGPPKTHTEERP